MPLPYLFISFVLFLVWLNWRANRAARRDESVREAFWAREHKANSTRKQSLSGLDYITIPPDLLPSDCGTLSDNAHDAAMRIDRLREDNEPIVNLTGYTNTDLKLTYGAANLNELSVYDAHYTLLATSLQDCGGALYDSGRFEESAKVLEFAVQTGTDVTRTYKLLLDMYENKLSLDEATKEKKLDILLESANNLRSLSKDGIVSMVEEKQGVII